MSPVRGGRACPGARRGDERGQTAVLIIGLALVLALMVVVVVDASAAYLRRQALLTLADGAALAAADGIAGEQVYLGGLGDRAVVDPHAAQALAEDYLARVGAASRYPGLTHHVESDGPRVVVHLSVPLELPLPFPGTGDMSHVRATGAAVVTVGE